MKGLGCHTSPRIEGVIKRSRGFVPCGGLRNPKESPGESVCDGEVSRHSNMLDS